MHALRTCREFPIISSSPFRGIARPFCKVPRPQDPDTGDGCSPAAFRRRRLFTNLIIKYSNLINVAPWREADKTRCDGFRGGLHVHRNFEIHTTLFILWRGLNCSLLVTLKSLQSSMKRAVSWNTGASLLLNIAPLHFDTIHSTAAHRTSCSCSTLTMLGALNPIHLGLLPQNSKPKIFFNDHLNFCYLLLLNAMGNWGLLCGNLGHLKYQGLCQTITSKYLSPLPYRGYLPHRSSQLPSMVSHLEIFHTHPIAHSKLRHWTWIHCPTGVQGTRCQIAPWLVWVSWTIKKIIQNTSRNFECSFIA